MNVNKKIRICDVDGLVFILCPSVCNTYCVSSRFTFVTIASLRDKILHEFFVISCGKTFVHIFERRTVSFIPHTSFEKY